MPPAAQPYDYVSPNFRRIELDAAFPNMIVADPATATWPYLRRGPQKWYCDQRIRGIGFLNRDEAHILYNTALCFTGKPALEIGCFMGWSACHMAAAGVALDVIDPMLRDPNVRQSVIASLQSAPLTLPVHLHGGASPEAVELLSRQGRRWSLIFIDGDHDFPAPVRDAVVCEHHATADAVILFHDMTAPAVAEGLYYLRDRGWNTRLYHTQQIMGAAWRGAVSPVDHVPDPGSNWPVPDHLRDLL